MKLRENLISHYILKFAVTPVMSFVGLHEKSMTCLNLTEFAHAHYQAEPKMFMEFERDLWAISWGSEAALKKLSFTSFLFGFISSKPSKMF